MGGLPPGTVRLTRGAAEHWAWGALTADTPSGRCSSLYSSWLRISPATSSSWANAVCTQSKNVATPSMTS